MHPLEDVPRPLQYSVRYVLSLFVTHGNIIAKLAIVLDPILEQWAFISELQPINGFCVTVIFVTLARCTLSGAQRGSNVSRDNA